ncbi:Mu transposase C-terminal domain-containing protein [Pseudoxanthomonas sp. PXM01]|uniref:Mu transposase C-terminal domain-containing protein n=1 Tax=Pseudoxanthomonas sp. PXM01 TaxID=2769295 RepID=UPI0017850F1F|nr:Mu transposase C-terminal domain-containing protein [Pseudoxanthomonas sp. PXM01]MBD9467760.1 transposase [Pseudoxanthomonas sp. PXM01]
MQSGLRVKALVAAFDVVRGTAAVHEGRAVRVMDVCDPTRIQVQVEGTRQLIWVRAEQLSAPEPAGPVRLLVPAHDADPDAQRQALAWSDALGQLPLQPTRQQIRLVAVAMQVDSKTVLRRFDRFLADPSPQSQLAMPPGPALGSRRLSGAQEAIIDRAIHEVHLQRTRAPMTAVAARVRQLCAEVGIKAPSYGAIKKRIKAVDPMKAATKRLGADRALAVQAPSVRGLVTYRPLEMVQIDHALVDLVVVCPKTRQPIGRPWITVAIDVHTRCVVGYYLSMDPPTQTCVALCLAHACLPKHDWMRRLDLDIEYSMFGRFEAVSWDNAKTFRASGIQAQCERYGIRVHLRPVKKPHYGAYIERYIGNLMGKIHLLPGTTFSNPQQRKDYASERHAIMTLQELAAWLGNEIAGVYHHSPHRGLEGKTPAEKWQAGWIRPDGSIGLPSMIANPRHFLIGLLPRDLRAVTREGISKFGLRYWDPAIAQLINDGRRHHVHYHHGDLTKVFLHYQGDYIDVPLLDRTRPPFTYYELREAKRTLDTQVRSRAREEVIFAAMARQRQIQDEAAATSKRVRQKQARRAPVTALTPPAVSVDYSQPIAPVNFEEADEI